jgi:hypothetical protein
VTPVRQPKRKAGSTAQPEAERLLAAAVDELGALEAELAPLKPRLARAEALRSALRARFEGQPADAACEARGNRFIAALGPKATERTVDVAELTKRIGWRAVMPLAKVALNALARLTDPPLVNAAQASIRSAPTGPRPLKIFALGGQEPRSGDQVKA